MNSNKFQIFDQDNVSGELTIQEFCLLNVLASQPGCALKRRDLCEAARDGNYIPTERAIDVKIARIRKKIGDDADNPQIIKTVRGVGYMLNHV